MERHDELRGSYGAVTIDERQSGGCLQWISCNRVTGLPETRIVSGLAVRNIKTYLYSRQMDCMDKVNLTDAFASFDEHWSPRLAGELNGQAVKLAKVDGEFVWHQHEAADELFLVSSGELRIEFRDRADVVLQEGEFVIVPRGVEHRPVAENEAEIILFEPRETRNTGDVETEQTETDVERID